MALDAFKQRLPQGYKYDIESFDGNGDDYNAVLHVNLNNIKGTDVSRFATGTFRFQASRFGLRPVPIVMIRPQICSSSVCFSVQSIRL